MAATAYAERLQKLRDEAMNADTEAKHIMAEYDGKEMPEDVRTKLNKHLDDIINKAEEIKRLNAAGESSSTLFKADPANRLPVDMSGAAEEEEPEYTPFQEMIIGEKGTYSSGRQVVSRKALRAVRKAMKSANSEAELKALQMNLNDQGGYLVPLQQFVAQLVQKIHDQVFIEQNATVFTVDRAQSLGAPSLDATFNDADWSTDVATVNEDTALKTGKRELYPTQLTKLVKLSRMLLRQSAIDPDMLVRDELAYKFAITKEKGFMAGSGANQPLGLFTSSTNGISTNRDVTAANSTKVVSDDFINAKMNLKAQYMNRPTTRWIIHRNVLKSVMTEKASTAGTYMFMLTGLTGAIPATILETPYILSEYAPSTLTTGLYVAIIGDLKFYWIANALEFEIQVLNELYAVNNMVGYIGRLWSDGMPVLEEPFSRLKLA